MVAVQEMTACVSTRVCVINESTRYRPFVTFDRKDTEIGAGTVAYLEQTCAEGTFSSGEDVLGSISPDKALNTLTIHATNPWIGKPSSWLIHTRGAPYKLCTEAGGFNVNEVRIRDDGVIRYVIQHLPDNRWKEFTITVSDSQDPASDGIQRACRYHGGAYPA